MTLAFRADVPTDAPARYAKQLVSHLGHRVEFSSEETAAGLTSSASIGSATATIAPGEGVLTLLARGEEAADVARVQDVLGRHLERFGARNELVVEWKTDDLT
jgi:hypothetical protein